MADAATTPTLDEALAVVENAVRGGKARAALSVLRGELGPGGRDSTDTTSRKPRFPTKDTVAEHLGDTTSAKGGHSSEGAKGEATARKGT